ncbi:MAG: hypothetical protein M5F18_02215 [Asgard group archaeon]|nr:hypothetical protein [Asgard group archaeon]
MSERTANIAVMVVGVDEMAQKQSTNKNQIWFEKKKKIKKKKQTKEKIERLNLQHNKEKESMEY